MKLVIDVNIVISTALNFEGKTRELIFLKNFELFAPDFLSSELGKHKLGLLEKSKISEKDFDLATSLILSRITLIPHLEFKDYLEKARKVCPDPNDEEYFALSLSKNIPLWSKDKALKNQNTVKVISTKEIIKILEK